MNNSPQSEFNKNTQIGMFLYFSQLMDRPVFDKDGVRVGEVYDIAIRSQEVYPLSNKLVIRKGFINRIYAGIMWQDVDSVNSKKISGNTRVIREKYKPLAIMVRGLRIKARPRLRRMTTHRVDQGPHPRWMLSKAAAKPPIPTKN